VPTLAACKSCGKRLRIPEGVTAAKARCPGCGSIIALAKTDITLTPPIPRPREDEKRRPAPDPEGITQDLPTDDQPRPRKKKRKRRSKPKPTHEVPLWVWGALAGTFLLLAGIVSIAVIHAGYGLQLFVFAIGMAIILPVSIVILVISMFITSALLGGIDFGQAHIAIPKAGALLFVVNLLSMIPMIGPFLALPVWFLGLMGLFGLDFVEARTLVAINWSLNTIFKYFVLAAILSGMLHNGGGDDPRKNPPPEEEDAAVKKMEVVGKFIPTGPQRQQGKDLPLLAPRAGNQGVCLITLSLAVNDPLGQRFQNGTTGGGRQTRQLATRLRGQLLGAAACVFQTAARAEIRA